MNKPEKVNAIIFDCDGVIIDSEYLFTKSLIRYLNSKGNNVQLDDVKHLIGIPLDGIIKIIIKDYNLTDSFEEIDKYFWEDDFVTNHPTEITPMDGLVDFVQEAYKRGITLAVGSSSPGDYVDTILEQFNIKKYFSLVLTISEVPNGKPAPDIYNTITERLGLDKKQTVVIEDSTNGIKAGKAAEIFTIGFKGSKVSQKTDNADAEAYSYKEVKNILKWEEN